MAEKLPEFSFSTPEARADARPSSLPSFAMTNPVREKPGYLEDIGKGAVSGIAEGVVGLPGIPGSLGQLYDLAAEKMSALPVRAAEKLGMLPQGKTAEDFLQSAKKLGREFQSPAEQRGEVNRVFGVPLPTSYGMVQGAKRMGMPTYDPVTGPGQYTKTVTEMLPGALVGPGTLANKLAIGTGAALSSETAGQMFKGTENEGMARFLGSIPGALAGQGVYSGVKARGPVATTERAEKVAGTVLREAESDPAKAYGKLEAELRANGIDPKRYVEGFRPTGTQIVGTPEAADLERRIVGIGQRAGSPEVGDLMNLKKAQTEAIQAESAMVPGKMQGNVPTPDVKGSFGLQGYMGNPQGEASIAVKNMVTALEEAKDKAAKQLWESPELARTNVYRNKAVSAVDNYLAGISPSERQLISPEVMKVIDEIRNMQGRDVPLKYIQDLRSQILSEGRVAGRDGNFFSQRTHNELGKTIADVLNDGTYIVFGDKGGTARDTWNKARAATKDYYETFEPKFMADLIKETRSGSQKISPEATFARMFGGDNAVQNLREVRSALGGKADKYASDWLIGDLTKNGTKVDLTPSEIQKWLADPKRAALVDEVPGLRNRIANVAQRTGESAQAAQSRQLLDNFQYVVQTNNPKVISKFLQQHGDAVKGLAGSPAEAQFIDQLKRSTDIISSMPTSGRVASTKTMDRLLDNDIFTILYGRAVGSISDGVSAALAAALIKKTLGISLAGAEAAAFTAGSSGAAPALTRRISNVANKAIFGGTQEESLALLQRSMADPQLRAALMAKPTADNMERLSAALNRAKTAPLQAVGDVVAPTAEFGAKIMQPGAIEEMRERPQRKAGGRVSHETMAEHLVMKAEKHKKAHSKNTERLLEEPDERIVKALDIAKQHI